LRFSLLFLVIILSATFTANAQNVQASDTVMVLPFENTSGKPEFNWVGESFADALSDLLKVPTLNVVTNEERKIIQQRLKIPLTTLPSLATSLKLAREGRATLLIAGRYGINPAQGDTAASINVTAKIIRVNEGRFLNEELADGRRVTRDITLIDALANLQTIEGQIAYQILYQRDKNLPFPQKYFVEQANKVPARAFEAYIKGLLTPEADVQTRESFLKNAMRLFEEAKAAETEASAKIYADAALELGHLFLNQKQTQNAIDYFSRVPDTDVQYAEAAFYIGLIYWTQNRFDQALSVLTPLADELKLTTLYNNLGAISVESSRAEKKDRNKSSARLNEGISFLRKASESDPEDPESRFNLAVALFVSENFKEAADQIRPVLALNPRDGEAYYVLAKILEKLGDPTFTEFDNQARRFMTTYAKVESEWQRSKELDALPFRVAQPSRRDFVSVVMVRKQNQPVTQTVVNETDALLEQARNFFKAGKDDDAMQVLRRVLSGEPMSAEAYLILGRIHLRRSDMEQAVSSLKTALFWDIRLIDAHIALAKIFIEKKDCQQAQTYVASAIALDGNNAEATGLQRMLERCSK
jgi:cytochrome c-type biogenesis protein CcmH/NrfG/TolB-like protein